VDRTRVRNVEQAPTSTAPAVKPVRVLWRVECRKQFRCQIITAAIYKHPHGQELRVFLGAEEDGNLLHSELVQWEFTPPEEKAASLREGLLEKELSELPPTVNGQD
jgi:hypothetical protein